MRVSKIISLMASTLVLSACTAENNDVENKRGSEASPTSFSSKANSSSANTSLASLPNTKDYQDHSIPIAATIGDDIISLEDVDARIQLALFDLEWQKYQLRKDALNSFLSQEIQANTLADEKAIITLEPPAPPRIGLPKDQRPIMGTPDAAITMDVFCSYQSSHCARLYPTLSALEQKYSGMIGFRFFDYPQRFHRYGISAANAFRCVADFTQENNKLWAFQSALFANIEQLNHQRYMILAEQLTLNTPEFEECLIGNHHQKAIAEDIAFGKEIGLGNVPVVFINGLYVKGANPAQMYSFYIDQELSRMGHTKPIQASRLPITLLATTVSNLTDQSTADMTLHNNESVIRVRIGEFIQAKARIIDIQASQILIDNQGVTEFIKIQTSQGHQLADAVYDNTITNQADASADVNDNADEELNDESQHRTLPVTGEMILSREWVDNQLLNQTALEKHFYNADHVVEGNHLIKLDNVDNQRFYTTLGLKTGDVVMRINDKWVHETQNPLWASLQQNEAMTLTVVRKGLPYRYDYRIE
jgi:protein-disulfide isomerase/type II secretory pathway component PulC